MKGTRRRVKAYIILALLSSFCLALFAGCSGGNEAQSPSTSNNSQQQIGAAATPAQNAGSVEVKASVDDYSWEELSTISAEIAAAGDEAAAVEVAKQYNLVGPNGQLDGTQTKMIGWQGSQVPVQIIGFAHDDKSDGMGKAGITFQFVDCIAEHAVNPELATDEAAYAAYSEANNRDTASIQLEHPNGIPTNLGGWESSEIRTWLNSELESSLPSELASSIVAVDKETNNVGFTQGADSITVTSDRIWLPSAQEICGSVNWQYYVNGHNDNDDAYNNLLDAEGRKYKLYVDLNTSSESGNNILLKHYQGQTYRWWMRSPVPSMSESFFTVNQDGNPGSDGYANSDYGVAPCFCI